MRLGLLGGSFNPIHRCHLSIAQSAQQLLQLDRVLFIPTGDPPHKQPGTLAAAQHRYRMVELAIQGVTEFALTDMEIRRSGKSYSIDTVRAVQQEYGPRHHIIFHDRAGCVSGAAFLERSSDVALKLPVRGVFQAFGQFSNPVVDPALSWPSRRPYWHSMPHGKNEQI